MSDDLKRRLAVAGVLIPVCVAVVYAGGIVFPLGLALLAGIGMDEFQRLFRERGTLQLRLAGIAAAALLPVVSHFGGPGLAWYAGAPLLLALTGLAAARIPPDRSPVTAAGLTTFGALYVGGLLSFAVPLREGLAGGRLEGTLQFFYPVLVTWLADTAAYLGGKRWGRRKLAPTVSPNKTQEGAAAALATATVAGGLYGWGLLRLGGDPMGPWASLGLGLAVGAAAVGGDLAESILKRECGVKDSSNLLPGHGGMLDRLDALLWVFPVAYAYLRWVA